VKLADADRKKLPGLLAELARAVEELLLSGLTTASETTRQTLQVAFQEASRLRLLRLGSTLRVANEELGRFTRNQADFSRRRLCFFLNRAWLLSRGLAASLAENDDTTFDRLVWAPAGEAIEQLEVVTLGAGKKVAAGAFVAFDFRLRALADAGKVKAGQRLAWSCVFPIKHGVDIPPEGFLHLPQKQKFNASLFLEHKVLTIVKAAVTLDEWGGGRISLSDGSTVTAGEEFEDWKKFLPWDPALPLERIRSHQPGPFDLEVEMQEEVVLHDWEVGEPAERAEESQLVYPIQSGPIGFDAVVSQGVEGKALRSRLEELRKKKRRPPLYGLMHYERCRLVLQPLATVGDEGPEYLTISDEAVDQKALLKALRFT
jgi:hypothetical protein